MVLPLCPRQPLFKDLRVRIGAAGPCEQITRVEQGMSWQRAVPAWPAGVRGFVFEQISDQVPGQAADDPGHAHREQSVFQTIHRKPSLPYGLIAEILPALNTPESRFAIGVHRLESARQQPSPVSIFSRSAECGMDLIRMESQQHQADQYVLPQSLHQFRMPLATRAEHFARPVEDQLPVSRAHRFFDRCERGFHGPAAASDGTYQLDGRWTCDRPASM